MPVTYNESFNLYEGSLAERPAPGVAYLGSFYRVTGTGRVYRCEDQPPADRFMPTHSGGYFWNHVRGTLFSQVLSPAGDTIGNTLAPTKFATQFVLRANTLRPGSVIRVYAQLVGTAVDPSPGTLKIGLVHTDGVSPVTLLAIFGGIGYPLSAGYTSPIELRGQMTCTASGAGGTLEAFGTFYDPYFGTGGQLLPFVSADNPPFPFNTTVDQTFSLEVEYSVANPANTITLRQFILEILQSEGAS